MTTAITGFLNEADFCEVAEFPSFETSADLFGPINDAIRERFPRETEAELNVATGLLAVYMLTAYSAKKAHADGDLRLGMLMDTKAVEIWRLVPTRFRWKE